MAARTAGHPRGEVHVGLPVAADRLHPMIEQGVDPDPIPFDLSVCGGCGWRHQCYPPRSFGEGTNVITDALLIEDLEAREQAKPTAAEFKALDASIKDRLKLLGISAAVAGDFVIEGTERKDGVVVYEIRRAG